MLGKIQISENRNKILLLVIFFFQLVVCIWFGHVKQTFFTDETYSYGFANSEEYTFLSPINDEWFGVEFFKNYVTSSPDKIFHFKQAYINQVNDVHPPLYYYLLHMVSSLSGDNFTKWTGIGLNLFLLIFADLLLYYVAREFLKSPPKALLTVVLWSFGSAGISNILFIRMYFLLTIEILAFIAVHIKIANNDYKLSFYDCELLLLTIILGGFTHYHFYVFASAFALIFICYLLFNKKYTGFGLYILSILSGLILNYIHFPAVKAHILNSFRGVEVLSNLKGSARWDVYTDYLKFINDSFGGGLLWILILSCLAIILYKNFINLSLKFEFNKTTFVYITTIFSTIIYLYVAIQGLELVFNRYIYPCYPILALIMINLLFFTFKQIKTTKYIKYSSILCLLFIMCFLSIKKYGIEHSYPEIRKILKKVEMVKGYDCLLYYDGRWHDHYGGMPLKFGYDEFYFFNLDNVDKLNIKLQERKTKNPLVVTLPIWLSEKEEKDIMNRVLQVIKYKDYYELYSFWGHKVNVLVDKK